jgi:transposase
MLGHDVRLFPPIYVKPYVKRQKNDAADAEAICEAVQRPTMRFVAVESAEQQGVLMLHRARELLVGQRTALINALRGHFAEFGIVVAQGPQHVGALVQRVMEQQDASLPHPMRTAFASVVAALLNLGGEIGKLDKTILASHRRDQTSVNLATIPGIGPLIASCLSASVPDARRFACGRKFAAYLGLVPKQNSTGGKPRLGRISKMDNRHLRTLLVVGAHAALYRARRNHGSPTGPGCCWPRSRSSLWPWLWPTRWRAPPGPSLRKGQAKTQVLAVPLKQQHSARQTRELQGIQRLAVR